ncbi:DNA polymerase III subunit alpha [candidate division WOR-1 bacterium RIFOXYB2_FULL_42_35]|uniref:DNA polymerase III subunit alpha n=1 Tax=candidate division WOR-1 bacterium RIFOXYC2_FULL_41_25 TaxID=1802586 RepID=A0A1F4TNY2_UNCSA|nr:MAG: DNA polymerase III subunit alpha [candidate division WOR-1 bacterium RIFOXYA2_FULL_41_14]OGC24816.1 MAG: DNA polymerase III subunit alpha [candidate division WOR-1 bacterium RIFOXYB2_FULL_42_35]OGC34376.1 MAG: DNA polymerase III subunit alpha [candidate division WOR-1 bacterium RIFOXYC2_FULL_41_25]OGC42713.1 MAG: DNA polymerase III subunit alpha [candidate division WOR-1 bacterium RIFOXYD2_FULL_41_8]
MPHQGKFVHLHCHSEFSLLDGAARISDLIQTTKDLGMQAVALTDHGNMHATINFYSTAKAEKIKPILGCEMYLAPRTRFDKETKEDRSPNHLTVLAANADGYKNLTQLVSLASLEGFYSKPRIDRELLEKHRRGLVVLSGCVKGEIPSLLMQDKVKEAREVAAWYKELLGDNFYLEMQELDIPEFRGLNPQLVKLSQELGIKLVATNDIHYVRKSDAYAQDVLLCIQTAAFVDDTKRLKLSSEEFYLKSPEEMIALFSKTPEAIKNTLEVAEKCNVDLELGKLHLPDFPVPEKETPDTFLEQLVWQGVKEKYGVLDLNDSDSKSGSQEVGKSEKILLPPEIIDRVKYELYTIEKMDYAAYFLIVADFINFAKKNDIQVGPGRGSAAGSIVAYALGITNVDPLKYGLIFERFLNIERISMPDIDIDFCIERRNEVIEYVAKKYGQDHVAQIVTFGTMAARGVIRDVGRVLRVPLPLVDKIAKLVPFAPDITLSLALEMVKELKELYDTDEQIKKLLDTAKQLEGLARHASVHAAGVVISKNPLTDHVPLQRVDKTVIVTQFPMGDLEKIGLLKMDFLGLRNLTMMGQAVKIIKRTREIDLDLNKIPLDDQATYNLLCSGETMGVFQLESSGMRGLIKNLQPNCFEEIIALLALYRPGPLESGMVDDYVKRKHRQIPVKYMLPELEPILRETHGTILYQEQVMEIASKIAGFSMGQADLLRRAMGKKKTKEMQQQKEFFVEGAVKKGVSHHKATELFNLCAKFAGYGFNKSHSTAYGVISYQTAYLKTNYTLEFMAAILTSVMGNADKVTAYISEARRLGIKILPPDINESYRNFTVTKEGIRFGLSAVKNIGAAAIDSIIESKTKEGPFASLADLCKRVDTRTCNKKVIESLIKAGGFDSFGHGRAYQLAVLGKVLSRAASEQKERANGQSTLFDFQSTAQSQTANVDNDVVIDEFPPDQLLRMEKEMLGIYISSHPLEHVRDSLEAQANVKIVEIAEKREGEVVKIGGILTECRNITTKKGRMMMIATIEDLTGSVGLVIFPSTFDKVKDHLKKDVIIIVQGKINRDMRSDDFNVVAESIGPMEELEKVRSLHIELVDVNDTGLLARMKELLMASKGRDPVFVRLDGKMVQLGNDFQVDISPELVEQLEGVLGTGAVNVEFRAIKKEKQKQEVNF